MKSFGWSRDGVAQVIRPSLLEGKALSPKSALEKHGDFSSPSCVQVPCRPSPSCFHLEPSLFLLHPLTGLFSAGYRRASSVHLELHHVEIHVLSLLTFVMLGSSSP